MELRQRFRLLHRYQLLRHQCRQTDHRRAFRAASLHYHCYHRRIHQRLQSRQSRLLLGQCFRQCTLSEDSSRF